MQKSKKKAQPKRLQKPQCEHPAPSVRKGVKHCMICGERVE